MKTCLYSILCILLSSCGQTQNSKKEIRDTVALTSNPSSVSEIKKLYTVINDKLQRNQLDSTSFKYDCNGEISGTVTYFSERGRLTMIKHSYSEYSHYSAVDQYFISRDSLFFVYSNQLSWSFESGQAAEGATKDDITEKRLYIAGEKPLLCLEKKYTERSHASDNPDPQKIASREVACRPIQPVLKDYGKLLAFRESTNHDCLGK